MTNSAQFDSLPLLAAEAGLGGLLGQMERDLETYFAAPDANREALQSALAGSHSAGDALRTLSLDGAAVFCGEIEVLLQELLAGTLPPASVSRNALLHALLALTQYLDAPAGAAGKPALCLFLQYQELQQARGMEMSFEADLFFPDLQVDLPPSVLAQPPGDAPQACVKAERGKYQAALLKWLRRDNPVEALQSMRNAVQAVMVCAPQDRQRAFWWVASALLDCMIYRDLTPRQGVGKLLSRIYLQMKALAEGQPADTHGSLREMLYLIAGSDEASDTVAEVKRIYALESYLPQACALPAGKTEPVLQQMRVQLEKAKESWEQCARQGSVLPEFYGQLEHLVYLAEQLDPDTLQPLCQQIQDIVSQELGVERIQQIALDMAMALLLLDDGMEHYRHLGGEFHEQVRILGQRLQAALAQASQDEDKLAELVTLHCRMQERSVMAALVSAIQDNLRHVGQDLNGFSGDTGQRQTLVQTGLMLQQVQGGLHILAQDRPEQLLHTLRQAVEYYAAGGNPAPGEMDTIAAALGALQACAQSMVQGEQPDGAPLDSALHDMQALQQPAIMKTPQEQSAVAQAVAGHELWEGDELLEVFLEEAQEVLDSMRADLETIQLHPENREPLVTIRRGFHTLKGSGRMVGLTDLADVAWAVEQAMNKWLQGNQPATPGLLKLILDAEAAFKGWVDSLRAHGSTQVEADELVRVARQIETGAEPMPLAQPAGAVSIATPDEVPVAVVAPDAAPEPGPEIKREPPPAVDVAALPPSRLGLATEEAKQHVAALLWHLAELRESAHPAVSDGFLHEAHALAAINRSMGFSRIAELAHTLEQWLEAHMGHPVALSGAQLSLLERTVAMLDDMNLAVRKRKEPQAQPELIARLQADIEAAEQAIAAQPAPEIHLPEQYISGTSAPQQPAGAAQCAMEEGAAQDEVDEHLLPVFLEEANDLFPQVGSDMRAWCARLDDKTLGRSLQRSLHTLKGSARMAGAMRLGRLTHHMEERVVQAMSQTQHDTAFREELESYFDRIGDALEQLRGAKPFADQITVGAAAPQDAARRAMLRVRSGTVDRLVNEAGEISVARSRAEAELRGFKSGLLELVDSVNRLRGQLRELEIQAESQMQARVSLFESTAEKFDPLEFDRFTRLQELTRFMNESAHDVLTVQQTLQKNLDRASAALAAQTYLNRELLQYLMAIRMVPFESISERLYRIVRQTCKEMGKKASLELRGTEVELDHSVLDRMTAPLEHMLRNAIAHGLESSQQRERAGKPSAGIIRLALRQENNEVIFELSDDGAGIDILRLRQKAAELGMRQADAKMSDEQLMQLISTPGLTTATEVTEVFGRGVGMDVVRSEITALGGRIEVSSKRGEGARFISYLPRTMMATQALLARAGKAVYAIPAGLVEQVQQVKPAALKGIYRQGRVEWKGKPYPLHYLPRLLGNEECEPESHPYNRVLLLRSNEQRLAVHVDELTANREVVVKSIGPQLAHLPGIAGATVLGDGNVVLVINPVQLALHTPGMRKAAGAAAAEPVPAPPLVMVVDDSLTVRKITGRLLARAGYHVATAKDGVDALEQLGETSPAVMLLDIEMPRMDGFELTKHLRRDPKTRHLPIIMITSRIAEKHRDYAHELGVNVYLGKPYQEEELLRHIAVFIAVPEMG